MQWLYKMKVAHRLIVGFSTVLALTVILGVFSIIQLERVNQTSTEMEVNWLPSTRIAGDINTATSDFRIKELQHILSTDEKDMARYEKMMADIGAHLEKSMHDYAKLVSSPEERQTYDKFKAKWAQYMVEHQKVIELSRANKNEEARTLIRGKSQQAFDESSADLDKLIQINTEGGAAASKRGDELYASARLWVLILLVGAVALGSAFALLIAHNLVNQLGGEPAYVSDIAGRIADGDLSEVIKTKPSDQSSMLYAMKQMRDSLAAIVGQVRTGTETIATASSQVASGSQDLSARTEEQASSLEETASSMEELTSTVKQNADNARQANTLAASASEVAQKGGMVISKVVDTMGEINESARKIADIIGVIDGIAFQTNILALNAAVEAARAGEQGRGFAVVASEVRNLAQRSANAAKEIKSLIGESVEKVRNGSVLVNDAGGTMQEIVESVRRVTDIMGEISAASQEQTSGIEQINQAIAQMDEVTQQNAALVEEAAAASEAMQEQAARLAQAVSVFRLDLSQAALAAPNAAPPRVAAPRAVASVRGPAAKPRPTVHKQLPVRSDSGGDWEEF